MNKICTSVEQSKKLIELGMDVKTADMYLWATSLRYYVEAMDDGDFNEGLDTPAWSLSALLELMPNFTLNGFGNGQFNCRGKRADCYALVNTCPLDAAFEMVVWLKENGKLCHEKKMIEKD